MSLTLLGTFYKWNHAAFVFLCLAYFSEHHGPWIHPYGSRCQNALFKVEQCRMVYHRVPIDLSVDGDTQLTSPF